MSKCGPSNDHSSRASSDRPIHIPLRVPTIKMVLSATSSFLSSDDPVSHRRPGNGHRFIGREPAVSDER